MQKNRATASATWLTKTLLWLMHLELQERLSYFYLTKTANWPIMAQSMIIPMALKRLPGNMLNWPCRKCLMAKQFLPIRQDSRVVLLKGYNSRPYSVLQPAPKCRFFYADKIESPAL